MVYLITLLTFLSLGFLVVLYLKNVELKEQLNKSLEENADNLSDQISFQLENFAKTNQLETTKQLNQLPGGTLSTIDRYSRGFAPKLIR